jgi:HEAT repeat protein
VPPGDGKEQIGQWIRQLGSESFTERERASQELVRIGASALDPLRRLLKDPDPEIALRAKECITTIERDIKIDRLIVALKDQQGKERDQAISQLAALGPKAEKAVPALIVLLDDKDDKNHWYVVNTLQMIGIGARLAVPRLIALIRNQQSNQELRWKAARALKYIRPDASKVVPILLHVLNTEGPYLRSGAVEALGGVVGATNEVVPALIQALKDRDPGVRVSAIWAVGNFPRDSMSIVPELVNILKNGKGAAKQIKRGCVDPRESVLCVLLHFGRAGKPALPYLVDIVSDRTEDYVLVQTAIHVFQAIGPDAKNDLKKLVAMPNLHPPVLDKVQKVLANLDSEILQVPKPEGP